MLNLCLVASCGLQVDPYVFDVAKCVFINAEGHEIYCNDAEADGRISVNDKEAAAIEKKLKQCDNK